MSTVLFLTIQFSMSTKLNGFKYCYISLTIQLNTSHLFGLHLCRRVRPSPSSVLDYYTKQSDGDVPVIMELWGIQSIPSMPSLRGPLWSGVLAPDSSIWAPDRVLSMGQIELSCVLLLNCITWNRTVLTCKLRSYSKLNCS